VEIDRRALLKRAGLLAGTGALAGLTGCEPDRAARPAAAPSGWAAVRARFDLDPDRRHFAAFVLASHPRPVADAIQRHRDGLQADPDGYLEAHGRRLDRAARAAAAGYLGGSPDGLAFTRSTTDGLGLLYGGLRLRPGQEVVTTEHDFYATHEALRLRAERTGATVRRVALYDDPAGVSVDGLVAAARRGIGPRTRVLALTWVHSGTGVKLPLREITAAVGELNRDRDPRDRVLVCVDAVHALGVESADAPDLGCDFLVAGCHKWLFGPRGTGLVWGRDAAWDQVTGTVPSFDRRAIGAWIGGRTPRLPGAALFEPGGFQAFEHRWALAESDASYPPLRLSPSVMAAWSCSRTSATASASTSAHSPATRHASTSAATSGGNTGRHPGNAAQRAPQVALSASLAPAWAQQRSDTSPPYLGPAEASRSAAATTSTSGRRRSSATR
jgi:selenocysteine lyase/cysteine desulfurase